MSGNQNGGGGGCIVVTIGDVKHTHALDSAVGNVAQPIRFELDQPKSRKPPGTNGGGGGCIRVKIGEVEHKLACTPTDRIEFSFDFASS